MYSGLQQNQLWLQKLHWNKLQGTPFPCVEGRWSSPACYPIHVRPTVSWTDSALATLQFPPASFFQFENPAGTPHQNYFICRFLGQYWLNCYNFIEWFIPLNIQLINMSTVMSSSAWEQSSSDVWLLTRLGGFILLIFTRMRSNPR